MVLLHLKHNNQDTFLFEATTSLSNDDLIDSIVSIHNKRFQSKLIAECARGLALYGIMKKPDEVGSSNNELYKTWTPADEKEKAMKEDPSGIRIGYAPNPNLAETLQRTAKDLDDYVNKNQVQKRIPLVENALDEKMSNVRGAVMMAYPMGLPEWDTLSFAFGSFEDLKVSFHQKVRFDIVRT